MPVGGIGIGMGWGKGGIGPSAFEQAANIKALITEQENRIMLENRIIL